MRIALFHNLPPGGALRAVAEFVRHSDPDVEFDLFTLDFDRFYPFGDDKSTEPTGVIESAARHVYREPVSAGITGDLAGGRAHELGLLFGIRSAHRRLARIINTGGYDVALVHPCWFEQSPSITRDIDIPLVYYMHEVRRATFEPDYRRGWDHATTSRAGRSLGVLVEQVHQYRDRRAVAASGTLLCNSSFTRSEILRCYKREATISYPGIDEETFTPGNRPPASPVRALCVGGMERFKGHHHVVNALATLAPDCRPSLHVVYQRCDETYRAEIVELCRSRGVALTEHRDVSDQELVENYRQASVTILAAQVEPFGLVPLESIACGTPVVAIDDGGYRETVVDGVNGYLVPRSSGGLAAGVARVLRGDLGTTPSSLRATVIPRWSWSTSVEAQVDHLRKAAGHDS